MSYDDESELVAVCLEEYAATCRHRDCLAAKTRACGHIGRPEAWATGVKACVLPAEHGGLWHRNHKDQWSTCRRHPGCDCPRHARGETIKPAEPHVCPEIIVVEAELIRNLQGLVDDLTTARGTTNAYETLRLILDKMEKGFRVPE